MEKVSVSRFVTNEFQVAEAMNQLRGNVGNVKNITKTIFEKQLKKNPPINRNMIKALYSQMGRKPSEKDINRVMETMNVKQPSPKKEKKNSKNDK